MVHTFGSLLSGISSMHHHQIPIRGPIWGLNPATLEAPRRVLLNCFGWEFSHSLNGFNSVYFPQLFHVARGVPNGPLFKGFNLGVPIFGGSPWGKVSQYCSREYIPLGMGKKSSLGGALGPLNQGGGANSAVIQ